MSCYVCEVLCWIQLKYLEVIIYFFVIVLSTIIIFVKLNYYNWL